MSKNETEIKIQPVIYGPEYVEGKPTRSEHRIESRDYVEEAETEGLLQAALNLGGKIVFINLLTQPKNKSSK